MNKDEHDYDPVYYGKCPEFDESYVGETGRTLQDRVDEHSGKDSKSNILRHSYEENHKMCPEIISKFLEMDIRRSNLNGSYLRHYTLKSCAPL